MKPKIYVTRKLPESVITKLKTFSEVSIWNEDTPVPREVLLREVKEVDGLFCLLTEDIDKELFMHANKLKVVASMAVGFNNIDVNEATKRGIRVTNTPGVLTETTADLTFALIMATARRLVEASDYLREGKWKTWSPMQLTGQDIYGATLGMIGMGRIAQAVVKRARGFNMNIIYHNRSRKPELESKYEMEFTDLSTLLKESDFVCVLIPYSLEVHHLIGEKEIEMMKNSSILINTARGGIVDEVALYHALKNKQIWAAGLDVFEKEPVSVDYPLLNLPNVITLPHIGSASKGTRLKMANLVVENLQRVLTGESPLTAVN
ncbi:2-hydroxyacid dehydrogenase [Oceanobacillus alkalisoli]|uniref:2-hydroxyacid dehydrogenase n=1 Tax=Oceanobacillus alkalisoli TaxID=2925113 RepID=UPI001F120B79|nr:D-glycerate dehydrogenase [Oceanobacillus alkalisoli]MCF3942572.1 D-glycerate dehydrogenase [Oceanobacillus alkalisoli]